MSITGMSSLIGYTRLHVAHLSARAVLDERDRRLALRTGENFEQFRVDRHVEDYMTPPGFCGTIHAYEARSPRRGAHHFDPPLDHAAAQTAPASPANIAEAYAQFLLGHRLEEDDDNDGAIAAYKRAMELDPIAPRTSPGAARRPVSAAEQDRGGDGERAGQALKIAPANSEANRVLGIVYAALSESSGPADAARARRRQPRQGDSTPRARGRASRRRHRRSERPRDAGARATSATARSTRRSRC